MITEKKLKVQIQLKNDTASNWSTNNTVLLKGEIGYVTESGAYKIGDGTTAWNSLQFAQSSAIVKNVAPTSADNTYQLGCLWINSTNDDLYVYTKENKWEELVFTTDIDKILPSQSENAGKVLSTDGTNSSWSDLSSLVTAPQDYSEIFGTDYASGTTVTMTNCSYIVGAKQLSVYYCGVKLNPYKNEYAEVGTAGATSNQIALQIPLKNEFDVYIQSNYKV